MRVPPAKSGTCRGSRGDDLRDGVLPPASTDVSSDPGQTCGEDEHLDLVETSTHAVQKVQQHPRVAFHRPADVAQENQRAAALLPLAPGEVDKLSTMRSGPSHHASEIEARATSSSPASGPAHADVPTEVGHHTLGLVELALVELGKVLLSDCFAVAVAQGCDLVDLEGRGNRRLCPIGIFRGRRFELRIASASLLAHGATVRRRPVTWRRTPEHAEGVVEQGKSWDDARADIAARDRTRAYFRCRRAGWRGRRRGCERPARRCRPHPADGRNEGGSAGGRSCPCVLRPVQHLLHPFPAYRLDVFLVLQHDPEGLIDRLGVEFARVEGDEGGHPVECFRDPGHFVQLGPTQLLDERRDLFGELCGSGRHLVVMISSSFL